ncbi:hypothetical protein [Mucilaginibacter humi]|uniref:hypothetical protein n=1 Tax=Mucilaginibacter humi TaxID=2732510 RepID=UPI001585AE53|nr:hypothetical protein [Mucilaginibacter humi]
MPMLNNVTDERERAQIIKYLNLSAAELDNIIREITQKSTQIIEKYPTHLTEAGTSGQHQD